MQVIDKNTKKRLTITLSVICVLLQLILAPNIPLFEGRINFMLILSALLAQLVGGRYGTIVGFLAGLFYDFCSTGPLGLMALLLTVSSYVLGMEVRNKLNDDPSVSITQFAIATSAVCVAYALALVMVENVSILGAIFIRALPSAIVTVICYLPFVTVLSRNRGGFTLTSNHSAGRSNKLH